MGYSSIKLCGEQTCNYLYVQNDKPSDNEYISIKDEPSEWKDTTSFYASFDNKENRLGAGDSEIIGAITGYEIYRKKYNEAHAEYICTVNKSNKDINDLIIDYSVKNKVDYTYYIYPSTDTSKSGAPLSALITKQIAIDVPYWSLFIVDETENENVFYLDKLFKFELNLQVDDMSNNAQVSVSQNFTKYPTVQYGAANYWSGSLSSLCGFMSTNCTDYVQTVNMIDELKSITSDARRKFLKDTEGNLWEVSVSSPISISSEYSVKQAIKTWKLSWVEVGDASKASIVSHPEKPTTDWVLTKTGEAIPYFTYQWQDQYIWDNSYIWTSNDDVYGVQNANLGREITKQG